MVNLIHSESAAHHSEICQCGSSHISGYTHAQSPLKLSGFKPFKAWTATDFLKGDYKVLDDHEGIACTLLPPDGPGETVVYKVDGASDYHVNSPYAPDSHYSFMLSGAAPACQDCRGTSMRRGSPSPRGPSGSSMGWTWRGRQRNKANVARLLAKVKCRRAGLCFLHIVNNVMPSFSAFRL